MPHPAPRSLENRIEPGSRLDSVDALRGLTVAAMLLVNNPGDWGHVFSPLLHAQWHGATPTDFVFPFFLFIVGVSTALSMAAHGQRAFAGRERERNVLARALRLFALGLVLNAVTHWVFKTQDLRIMGVLQRIALCFAVTGLVAIHARPRTQWLLVAGILLGYWALLTLGGGLTREDNLAGRIDGAIFGGHAYRYDAATGIALEPEGLLSTLPAIATTLLGLRAGEWLRRGELRRIVTAGLVCAGLGAAWSLVFPLNKQLWTSSYVLWTGGFAMLALAGAHQAVDRLGLYPLGRSMGKNAIAVYALSWLLVCAWVALGWLKPIYQRGFAWMAPATGPEWPSLLYAMVFVALWWLVALAMDRRKLYVKI